MNQGGKAKSLIKLRESLFKVPSFLVLSQNEIIDSSFPTKVNDSLGDVSLFAVRSSFVGEDEKEKSFAGHFYTGLGVRKENLNKELKKVLDSYNGGKGGVIVQQFICSDLSGVVFSNAGQNKLVINATYGLCESVVRGNPCDEYIIDRVTNKIISEKIELQKEVVYFKNDEFQKGITSARALSALQIKEITKFAIEIEKLFNTPQDIEFCYLGSELYILQSRPITKPIFKETTVSYYDSANIAESYSGLVLPLTLSFVRKVYSVVYKDLLCASGVNRSKIEKHSEIFDSLTESFSGRLYYNMSKWYQMMSFVPGYKRNKTNLELMISSNINNEIKRDIKPNPFYSISYYFIVNGKLLIFPIVSLLFKNKMKKSINQYSLSPIESMTLKDASDLYKELISGPLRKWYITVENDTALMTLLGKIHSNDKDIFNQINITTHSVSANQVDQLKKIADLLMTDHEIAEAINNPDQSKFEASLSANKELKVIYDQYFMVYGGRFANELKLESDDLRDDFGKFVSLIKAYHKSNYSKPKINQKGSEHVSGLLVRLISYFATNREEMRLLRSNMFSLVRRIFLRIGHIYYEKGYIKNPKDIFYLSIDEILSEEKNHEEEKDIIEDRKKEYAKYAQVNLDPHFSLFDGELPQASTEMYTDQEILSGSVSSPGIVSGKVRVFNEFSIPDPIDFDILVVSHTDPGWIPLIGLAKGLIVEYGGILSHASIVSRELGIPAVIGIKGVTSILKTGQSVHLDGKLGTVTILHK